MCQESRRARHPDRTKTSAMNKLAGFMLITLLSSLWAAGADASAGDFPASYRSALDAAFLKGHDFNRPAIEDCRRRLAALAAHTQELYARSDAEKKGKSLKKTRPAARTEDLVVACEHAQRLLNALLASRPRSPAGYALADQYLQLLFAITSDPPYYLRTYITELNLWDITRSAVSLFNEPAVSPGKAAFNAPAGKGDPPDSFIWRRRSADSLAAHDDLPVPESVRFMSIKCDGVQPKFKARFDHPVTGKRIKVKIKTGQEIHATLFSALVLSQLGYNTNQYRHVRGLKVYFDGRAAFDDFRRTWEGYFRATPELSLRKGFSAFWVLNQRGGFLSRDDRGYFAVLKSGLAKYYEDECISIGRAGLDRFANADRREVRGLLPIFAWLHLHDTNEENLRCMLVSDPAHPLGHRLRLVLSDLGLSLSHIFGLANPNCYAWNVMSIDGGWAGHLDRHDVGAVFSGYREIYPLSAFDRTTYEDARWGVLKLAGLSRAFIEGALARAAFPEPVRLLYAEAILTARNHLVRAFRLTGQCGIIDTVDRRNLHVFQAPDGTCRMLDAGREALPESPGRMVVRQGFLQAGEFPGSVVRFDLGIDYHVRTLLSSMGESTWDGILQAINFGCTEALHETIDTDGKVAFSVSDVVTVGAVKLRYARKIKRNEFATSHRDLWVVQDKFSFLIDLGPDLDLPVAGEMFLRAAAGYGFGQEIVHTHYAGNERTALRHDFFRRWVRSFLTSKEKLSAQLFESDAPQSVSISRYVSFSGGGGVKLGGLVLTGKEYDARLFLLDSILMVKEPDRLSVIFEVDPGASLREAFLIQLFLGNYARMKFNLLKDTETTGRYYRRVLEFPLEQGRVSMALTPLLNRTLAGHVSVDRMLECVANDPVLSKGLVVQALTSWHYRRRSLHTDLLLWEQVKRDGMERFDHWRLGPDGRRHRQGGYAYGDSMVTANWMVMGLKEIRRATHELAWIRKGSGWGDAHYRIHWEIQDNNTGLPEMQDYVHTLNILANDREFMPFEPALHGQRNFGPIRVRFQADLSGPVIQQLLFAGLQPRRACLKYLRVCLEKEHQLYGADSWREYYRRDAAVTEACRALYEKWRPRLSAFLEGDAGSLPEGVLAANFFPMSLDARFRGAAAFADFVRRMAGPDTDLQEKAAMLTRALNDRDGDPLFWAALFRLLPSKGIVMRAAIEKDPLAFAVPNLLPMKITLLSAQKGKAAEPLFITGLLDRYHRYLGRHYCGLRLVDYEFFLE